MTIWENKDDLDRFRASDAMRTLSAQAVGLTVPPHGEALYDLIEDQGSIGNQCVSTPVKLPAKTSP